ncbi:hypothetical protein FXF51_40585 [Nonomuraea sp. PA05]|uniref:hypothetical protein n=1 Tax=Nonomuraea sp. PA05 TaxID=2604466 RepID=UPI0011D8EB81|nr:hypothetical protein [Nonomuraea sp. PA05]TYB57467.1 hypothetical protein FXF51_40585 [Nonomuraea sp. PA05]
MDVEDLDRGVQVSILVGLPIARQGRPGGRIAQPAAQAQQAGLGTGPDVAPDVNASAQEPGPVHVGVDGRIPRMDLQRSQYVKSHHLPPLIVLEI